MTPPGENLLPCYVRGHGVGQGSIIARQPVELHRR